MKRFGAALIILTLVMCCALLGAVLLLRARTREGMESLAASADASGSFAAALFSTFPSAEAAREGREALLAEGYSISPAALFTDRLYSDGVLSIIAAFILAAVAFAVLFVLSERRKSLRREAELLARVSAALRGEAEFAAEHDDERLTAKLIAEIKRAEALRGESADETRRYVENVAHEIKSPTSGIMLNLDLIAESGLTENRLFALRKCAARIDAYTAGLLSLARLRAGKVRFSFEPTELSEVVEEAASELSANGISVSVTGEGAGVNADRARLKEAVRNLIVNAAKHGSGDEPVSVVLEAGESEASVRVADNGPGMKDASLIERYAVGQEDGSSFGIGLSLAREVAARHSGRLVVCPSESGAGVKIVIPRFKLKTSL